MTAAAPTETPAPQAGTNGGAPPAPQAPSADWGALVGSLPEPMREHNALKNAKGFEDFVSQHVNLEKALGSKRLSAPDPSWTEKEWSEFHTALGVPEKPEGYSYDGVEIAAMPESKPLLDRFNGVFKKAGLTPAQAKLVVQEFGAFSSESAQAQAGLTKQALESAQTELKTEWAGDYDKKLEAANTAARQLFGSEEKLQAFRQLQLVGGGFLGDSPLMLRMLSALGETLGEGESPKGTGGGALNAQTAATKLTALESDPENQKALNSRDHPRHKELVAERLALRQIISDGQKDVNPYRPKI